MFSINMHGLLLKDKKGKAVQGSEFHNKLTQKWLDDNDER